MRSFSKLPLCVLLASAAPQALTSMPSAHASVPVNPESGDVRLSEIATRHSAGIAVGVIRGSKLLWTGYYGEQSPGVPVTQETLFNVASLTKPVAAEAILRLVSEGKLALDEPMSQYWVDPDLVADPRHELLTPAIALSHRTGLPNWRHIHPDKKLRFEADPGTRATYSGEGYNYVARYAQTKLGIPFEDLVQTRVFEPAGMKSAALTRRDWMKGRVNLPIKEDASRAKPDIHEPGDWSAADDLFVTLPDYAAFVISVSRDEKLTSEVATARRQILTQTANCPPGSSEICPDPAGHSLGWEILTFGGRPMFWHTGGDWSESTFAYFYPDTGDGLIAFMNAARGNQPAMLDILDAIEDSSPLRAAMRAVSKQNASPAK